MSQAGEDIDTQLAAVAARVQKQAASLGKNDALLRREMRARKRYQLRARKLAADLATLALAEQQHSKDAAAGHVEVQVLQAALHHENRLRLRREAHIKDLERDLAHERRSAAELRSRVAQLHSLVIFAEQEADEEDEDRRQGNNSIAGDGGGGVGGILGSSGGGGGGGILDTGDAAEQQLVAGAAIAEEQLQAANAALRQATVRYTQLQESLAAAERDAAEQRKQHATQVAELRGQVQQLSADAAAAAEQSELPDRFQYIDKLEHRVEDLEKALALAQREAVAARDALAKMQSEHRVQLDQVHTQYAEVQTECQALRGERDKARDDAARRVDDIIASRQALAAEMQAQVDDVAAQRDAVVVQLDVAMQEKQQMAVQHQELVAAYAELERVMELAEETFASQRDAMRQSEQQRVHERQTLQQQHKRDLAELEHCFRDERAGLVSDWEQRVQLLVVQHQDAIRELKQQHQDAIGEMKPRQQNTIKQVQQQHQDKIGELQQQHEDRISELQDKIKNLEQQQQETIKNLEQQHQETISDLQQQHQNRINVLEQTAKDQLSAESERADNRIAALESQLHQHSIAAEKKLAQQRQMRDLLQGQMRQMQHEQDVHSSEMSRLMRRCAQAESRAEAVRRDGSRRVVALEAALVAQQQSAAQLQLQVQAGTHQTSVLEQQLDAVVADGLKLELRLQHVQQQLAAMHDVAVAVHADVSQDSVDSVVDGGTAAASQHQLVSLSQLVQQHVAAALLEMQTSRRSTRSSDAAGGDLATQAPAAAQIVELERELARVRIDGDIVQQRLIDLQAFVDADNAADSAGDRADASFQERSAALRSRVEQLVALGRSAAVSTASGASSAVRADTSQSSDGDGGDARVSPRAMVVMAGVAEGDDSPWSWRAPSDMVTTPPLPRGSSSDRDSLNNENEEDDDDDDNDDNDNDDIDDQGWCTPRQYADQPDDAAVGSSTIANTSAADHIALAVPDVSPVGNGPADPGCATPSILRLSHLAMSRSAIVGQTADNGASSCSDANDNACRSSRKCMEFGSADGSASTNCFAQASVTVVQRRRRRRSAAQGRVARVSKAGESDKENQVPTTLSGSARKHRPPRSIADTPLRVSKLIRHGLANDAAQTAAVAAAAAAAAGTGTGTDTGIGAGTGTGAGDAAAQAVEDSRRGDPAWRKEVEGMLRALRKQIQNLESENTRLIRDNARLMEREFEQSSVQHSLPPELYTPFSMDQVCARRLDFAPDLVDQEPSESSDIGVSVLLDQS